MRIGLINKNLISQQGQPIWNSHRIGLSNAIYWKQQKILHDKSLSIEHINKLNNGIKYLKRKEDLVIAFGIL